jgi:hypothetical protein
LVPGELGFSENIQDDQLGPNKGSNTFCANLPEHIFGPYTDDGKNEFEDECLIDCNENSPTVKSRAVFMCRMRV